VFAGAAAASSFARESASEGLRKDTGKDAGKAASLVEQLSKVPPFDPHGSRYNMQTYGGRCLHFFSVIGDLSTLATTQAQVERYREQLSQAGAEDPPTDAELWRARQVLMAVVHPQTGEVIPAVLRFSFFAPANLVICAGLLSPGATLARTAFFQWLNQTYNVAVNYANRSSGDVSPATLGAAYCAATSSSLAIALGLQAAAKRLNGGGGGGGGLLRLTVGRPVQAGTGPHLCERAAAAPPKDTPPPHRPKAPPKGTAQRHRPKAPPKGTAQAALWRPGGDQAATGSADHICSAHTPVPHTQVPALAVSVGGVINLLMTRGHELRQGVAVHAADGTPLGESVWP
jgi:hypothetical protein